ncbi:MAG: hypothetical protein AAGA85_02165 [Bacteroidota bacterium]
MQHIIWYIISTLLGCAAGLATLYLVPNQMEIYIWIELVLIHGFLGGLRAVPFAQTFIQAAWTGIWITMIHLTFVDAYLASHQSELAFLDTIKVMDSYVLTFVMIAPIYWVVLGSLAGGLALLAKRPRENRLPDLMAEATSHPDKS